MKEFRPSLTKSQVLYHRPALLLWGRSEIGDAGARTPAPLWLPRTVCHARSPQRDAEWLAVVRIPPFQN